MVNTQGELVGINTASFQQATDLETYGISFAIPYSLASKIMTKIIADGRVIRGYIGVDGQDINSMTSRLLGNEHVGGIIILGVDPNGPQPEQASGARYLLKIDGKKLMVARMSQIPSPIFAPALWWISPYCVRVKRLYSQLRLVKTLVIRRV